MPINRVILIGNVSKDPRVRYSDTGIAVTSFPLATTGRVYTLSSGTQVPERIGWHNLVLWRGLTETTERCVHKGDKLYMEGKIRTYSYDDQSGAKRYVTEIFADNMEVLIPKDAGAGSYAPSQQQAVAPVQPQPQQPQQSAFSQDNPADDLPF